MGEESFVSTSCSLMEFELSRVKEQLTDTVQVFCTILAGGCNCPMSRGRKGSMALTRGIQLMGSVVVVH